jgi:outer membrane protein OmpA-like peptidoglycan-associated protein
MADGERDTSEPEQAPPLHFEVKPAAYLEDGRRTVPPPSADAKRLVMARHGRRVDRPRPELQDPWITGRYESDVEDPESPPVVAWVLLLNQSSTYFEGKLVPVLDARTKRAKKVYEISGTFLRGSTFRVVATWTQTHKDVFNPYTPPRKEEHEGTILKEGKDLVVSFSGDPLWTQLRFRLMPGGERPTFMGDAMDAFLAGKGVPKDETEEVIRMAEIAPLHSYQVSRLARLLDQDKIDPLIQACFGEKTRSSFSQVAAEAHRRRALQYLEEYIESAMGPKEPGRWHSSDLVLLRDQARLMLAKNRSTVDQVERSQLQWIEIVSAQVRTSTRAASEMKGLSDLLGVRSGQVGSQEFVYDLKIELEKPDFGKAGELTKKGVDALVKAKKVKVPKLPTGVKLGASVGTLIVKKLVPVSPRLERKFEIYTAGFGFLLGTGSQGEVSATATLVTRDEWRESDFPGFFKILDGGAWFSPKATDLLKFGKDARDLNRTRNAKEKSQVEEKLGDALEKIGKDPTGGKIKKDVEKKAAKAVNDALDKVIEDNPTAKAILRAGVRDAALVLSANGRHRTEIVPLKGLSAKASGMGVNFFCSFGWIGAPPSDGGTKDETRPLEEREAAVDTQTKAEVHFPLGVAVLGAKARQRIRELCAAELPWFMFPGSTLLITGNCDRIDTEENNNELSQMRADNVKQAIKDVLGQRLKIPDTKETIVAVGLGEQEAAKAYEKTKHKPIGHGEPLINQARRRVDVVLNGRRVLTLWGA